MAVLTVSLFERVGLLLLAAFLLTRIPSFQALLARDLTWQTAATHSLLFGLFGIGGVLAGIVVRQDTVVQPLWVPVVEEGDALAHSGNVGVVMAGLLGGPVVGLGAGLITGAFLFATAGVTSLGYAVATPFVGLLAGGAARFFSAERVIAPEKSLFIGMFATILTMGFLLAFTVPSDGAVRLVNRIGIPMVLTNSIAIAVFTLMIRAVLHETERAQALETRRALKLADKILPDLKQGLTPETARATAQLLMNELGPAAVAIADERRVLAHVGLGADHHRPGAPLPWDGEGEADAGHVRVIAEAEEIGCRHPKCPLKAAIVVPFHQAGRAAGAILFYYKRPQQIRAVDVVLAQGLGRLISNQLHRAEAERLRDLMREAELRLLQAQVNPHFLFNTLHSIVSLIRVDPPKAREITLKLAQFLRTNLSILSQTLVPLAQELEHVKTYLDIVQVRFADRLHVDLRAEAVPPTAYVPPLTLQALAENSIQHGLKNKTAGGQLLITVTPHPDHVAIVVEDNGTGISEDLLPRLGRVPLPNTPGNGIGLYNVNQRLVTLFGERAALHIENKPEGGCRVSFRVPHLPTSDVPRPSGESSDSLRREPPQHDAIRGRERPWPSR